MQKLVIAAVFFGFICYVSGAVGNNDCNFPVSVWETGSEKPIADRFSADHSFSEL